MAFKAKMASFGPVVEEEFKGMQTNCGFSCFLCRRIICGQGGPRYNTACEECFNLLNGPGGPHKHALEVAWRDIRKRFSE